MNLTNLKSLATKEMGPKATRATIYLTLAVLIGVVGLYVTKFNQAREHLAGLTNALPGLVSKTYYYSCMRSVTELTNLAKLNGEKSIQLNMGALEGYCNQRANEVYVSFKEMKDSDGK